MNRPLLDQLVELCNQARAKEGAPPDFLIAPWKCLDTLELDFAAVCTQRVGEDAPGENFIFRMITGKVQVNGVPIHPGTCWGYGRNSGLLAIESTLHQAGKA